MTNEGTDKKTKSAILQVLKWFVLVLSYSFLIYKFVTFTNYTELLIHLQHLSFRQFAFLILVFILLPINIFLEAYKWQQLVSKTEVIILKNALKAVLAGFSTGFASPNRVAEMAGRMLYISPKHRKIAAVYSLLNSLTQNYVIALVGLPAAFIYFSATSGSLAINSWLYFIILLFFLAGITVSFFILKPIVQSGFVRKRIGFVEDIARLNACNYLKINFISLVRFCVFSVQFYCMLLFFGVDISMMHALISIPTSYLLVTFTPSFAFSEAAIRSSYAVSIIGFYAPQTIGIALAGFALWFINYGIPMMLGSRLLLKSNCK